MRAIDHSQTDDFKMLVDPKIKNLIQDVSTKISNI